MHQQYPLHVLHSETPSAHAPSSAEPAGVTSKSRARVIGLRTADAFEPSPFATGIRNALVAVALVVGTLGLVLLAVSE